MPGESVHPLLVALLLAIVVTAFHRRWPPRIASRFLAAVLVVLVIAAIPTVVLITVTFVAHVPFIGRYAQWCAHTLGHHQAMPLWLGIIGSAVAVTGVVRVTRVLRDHRRLACHSSRSSRSHNSHNSHSNHMKPWAIGRVDIDADAAPWAVTLPGSAGRIVLSAGLVAALDEREARVVLAHERAHARLRHDRYILIGELAAAMLPPLRWIASRLRLSVERWADEVAADELGDRRFVAQTIGKVALIATPIQFGTGFVGLGVVDRVQLMLRPPVVRLRGQCRVVITMGSVSVGAFAAYQWHHISPLLSAFCHV